MAWCRSALDLGHRDASRRVKVALRLLLTLLDDEQSAASMPVPPDVQKVLGIIEELATQGDSQLRLTLMASARALAIRYPAAVINRALEWVATTNSWGGYGEPPTLVILGTDMFLAMAAKEDPTGLAAILTGPAAITPQASVPVWSMVLRTKIRRPPGFENFEEASQLWLDTAVHRPELRPQIVAAFVSAASGYLEYGNLIVKLTRDWAGTRMDRRDVQEDILIRLLMPLWRRYLLILRVMLRSAFETRQ